MCELMGSEPIDSEIPLDFTDLYEEVQNAFFVYNMLQDNFDTMNGIYLGKVVAGIEDILNVLEIDDKRTCFYIIRIIDRCRITLLNNKRSKNKKPAK